MILKAALTASWLASLPARAGCQGARDRRVGVRRGGGYVVAAGTVVNGNRYDLVYDQTPAPLAGWLTERLTTPLLREAPARPVRLRTGHRSAYLDRAVTDECSHVITAVATEHNDALYMAAQNLGRLVAGGKQPFPVTAVLRTQTTRNENALLVPAGGTWNNDATSVLDVMRTRTTTESEALVVPLHNHNTSKPIGEVFDTFAAAGSHHGLLIPYYGNATARTPTTRTAPRPWTTASSGCWSRTK
jgi:hypothetical protein